MTVNKCFDNSVTYLSRPNQNLSQALGLFIIILMPPAFRYVGNSLNSRIFVIRFATIVLAGIALALFLNRYAVLPDIIRGECSKRCLP